MGLQWGHRLSTVEGRQSPPAERRASHRFNGATASQRWKAVSYIAKVRGWKVLQWGHRLSTVEGLVNYPPEAPLDPASMGPPPLNGGRA